MNVRIIVLLMLCTLPLRAIETNAVVNIDGNEYLSLLYGYAVGCGAGFIGGLALTSCFGHYQTDVFLYTSAGMYFGSLICIPIAEAIYYSQEKHIFSGYGLLFSYGFSLLYTSIPILMLSLNSFHEIHANNISQAALALLAVGFFINPILSMAGYRLGVGLEKATNVSRNNFGFYLNGNDFGFYVLF